VPIRKKNGEIKLCVDFRNLNGSSLKDNYPLPKTDHILKSVVGANIIYMIDVFFGYNHIALQRKTERKLHLPHHGAPLCMIKCHLV
jgi:hypothetical protein